ncbi:MAG: zf-HC2 domain-containing protein [Acidobacteriota bacterium]|nr:zf-HC2 domain-containing protein [Acidobacteriota bacterium]
MMHEHSCADVRGRLEAFCDGEVPFPERLAIQNHLTECVACSLETEQIVSLGATLRGLAAEVGEHAAVEPLRLSEQVVEQLGVEEQLSAQTRLGALFQDMHLVWAGIGATVATLICVVGSASVLHAANQERPDSLAAVISLLANPGSNANPVRLNYDMMAPRAVTDAALQMWDEEDAEYALSAVVSREGRVQGIEVINDAHPLGNRAVVNAMLNEAYRVQFAPAQARTGDAVAVSMVWLVANTTVKGRHHDDLMLLR